MTLGRAFGPGLALVVAVVAVASLSIPAGGSDRAIASSPPPSPPAARSVGSPGAGAAMAGPSTDGEATPGPPSGGTPGPPPSIRPSAGTGVDPLTYRSAEPAPMGIADFGVAAPGSGPYEYAAPSFEASAFVRSMTVSVAVTAFELNAVLVLRENGTSYSYWVQNGLHVTASTREFTIGGAYVWNFSAPGARLGSGELKGANGSALAADTYYYIPGCNALPGQCAPLTWPTTLVARINASLVGGVPTVAYQYDLGAGWVTYDTVAFLHRAGAAITGFEVDGFAPTPYAPSLFYDAEWVWVAAGGGSTMTDEGSDLTLTLSYWDGAAYRSVPDAWDFGGDTGETSSNVSVAFAPASAAGTPSAHLVNGAGTLGVLFNQSEVGTLAVRSPAVPNGTLSVNLAPLPFSGGSANLTVVAGPYGVSLEGYSNASESVFVAAGQTVTVDLSGAGRTVFEEAGLPPGTAWTLSVGGVVRSSTGPSVVFALPNGTLSIGYPTIPGFVRDPGDPANVVVPTASPVLLRWSPFTYPVPFVESGLPAGTAWWVNASGLVSSGRGTTLNISAANGSTAYTVGASYEFVADPGSGTITVAGGAFAPIDVQFTYRAAFIAGTVAPASARLTIEGVLEPLVEGSFNASVIPDRSYHLTASAPGYATLSVEAAATAGNVTLEHLVLTELPTATPGGSTGAVLGPLNAVDLAALLGGVGAVAIVGAVLWTRRRR